MKLKAGIWLAYMLWPMLVMAQFPSSLREVKLPIGDTLRLDSMSIRSETFSIRLLNGTPLPESAYRLNALESYVVINQTELIQQNLQADSVITRFNVYPFRFGQVYQNKKEPGIRDRFNPDSLYAWTFNSEKKEENNSVFAFEGLDKNGSLSRGISFGNTRDLAVSSSFNMQISGFLADSVTIKAAITDENIPVQPDGSTYRLQDFDKVFIEIGYRQHKLIAGDFYITRPSSHFLNVFKKAQGLQIQTRFGNTGIFKNKAPQGEIRTQASGAISRGKFAVNRFNGIEGNQGPYRLTGNEGESFITILSGTERVYIDGVLLKRGREFDYVIDYNTAELSFTPSQLITKDRRIVVEFEYSDRNYGRLLYHINNEWDLGKFKYKLNIFSEQDLKNQPLQQTLTDDQKLLLSLVGDSLNEAVIPSGVFTEFNPDEILYAKKDTLINGIPDTIFVYSTHPDSARYRVVFSQVGNGNGRYNQVPSTANGRVFKFVGAGQGSFEPSARLIAPQSQRMITFGTEMKVAKGLTAEGELAYSYNDINTFSELDNRNNSGYAFRAELKHILPFGKEIQPEKRQSQLKWKLYYEQTEKTFSSFVRFRNVEFSRDFNLITLNPKGNEYIPGAEMEYTRHGLGRFGYSFNGFIKGTDLRAYRNQFEAHIQRAGWKLTHWSSYTLSSGKIANTDFFRHRTQLSKTIGKTIIGLNGEDEYNLFRKSTNDSILKNSYMFNDWELYAGGADSSKISWKIYYRFRLDNLPAENSLKPAAIGQNTGIEFGWTHHPRHKVKINLGFRNLSLLDTAIFSQSSDNSAVGRVEYNGNAWKNSIVWSTYFEVTSGLENKRQYAYLPVNNGQGTHFWDETLDYNGNGVPDLDEFQPAQFNGQGNYIKVFTPSGEYVKTFDTRFNQTLNFRVPTSWAGKKGFKKFMAKLYWQNIYSLDRKSQNGQISAVLNPFGSAIQDTALLSLNSTLRSSLFYNRNKGKIGLEITYRELKNKILLTNGLESRQIRSGQFKVRYNITSFLTFNLETEGGRKENNSPMLRNRNFDIEFYTISPRIVIQPGTQWRLTLAYDYRNKFNLRKMESGAPLGGEKARIHQAWVETNIHLLKKGLISGKISLFQIGYNGNANTALGFEMIEALAPGINGTWNLNVQYNVGQNLQLTVNYEGRAGQNFRSTHIGGMQVRAFF